MRLIHSRKKPLYLSTILLLFLAVICLGVFDKTGCRLHFFKKNELSSLTPDKQEMSWSQAQQTLLAAESGRIFKFRINDLLLDLEIANSTASRAKGLSNRDEIGADGLLFVYAQPSFYQFWMKDMRFDLDFIWLSSGCVSEITPKASHQNQRKIYKPTGMKVEWVLEVPAGFVEQNQIRIGQCLLLMPS